MLRWPVDHALAAHRREVDGTDALRLLSVAVADGFAPPSPMDLGCTTEISELPRLPEATLTVQYEYPDGPFGHVSFTIRFVDGGVDSMSLGRVKHADATITVPFLVMAQVRSGELSILEALGHGSVTGDIGCLGLVAGISESPEFHRAELACGSSGLALGMLGGCLADTGYQAALEALAARTGPPEA